MENGNCRNMLSNESKGPCGRCLDIQSKKSICSKYNNCECRYPNIYDPYLCDECKTNYFLLLGICLKNCPSYFL